MGVFNFGFNYPNITPIKSKFVNVLKNNSSFKKLPSYIKHKSCTTSILNILQYAEYLTKYKEKHSLILYNVSPVRVAL
jgi:hypothetical protein